MKTIQYKNEKIPLFNTPLSENDIIKHTAKYGKFGLHNLKSGKIRIVSSARPYTFNITQIDPRTIIYFIGGVFAFYKFRTFQNKIKKKVTLNIFKNDLKKSAENFERELNKMQKKKASKKSKPNLSTLKN